MIRQALDLQRVLNRGNVFLQHYVCARWCSEYDINIGVNISIILILRLFGQLFDNAFLVNFSILFHLEETLARTQAAIIFLKLTYCTTCSNVSIVKFGNVIAGWVG